MHDQLRALLKQRPFHPFQVHLKDGRSYLVQYPHITLLGPSYIDIGFPAPDDPKAEYYDTVELVLFSEISRLETARCFRPRTGLKNWPGASANVPPT